MPPSREKAFSLTEMLVGIFLLAVLAVLLTGAFQHVVSSSRTVHCLNKLRQLGVAAHLFIPEHKGELPYTAASPNWMINLAPYLGIQSNSFSATSPRTTAFLCPDDPARSPRQLRTYRYHQSFPSTEGAKEYGKSNYTPTKYSQIARPSTHAMMFCIAFVDARQLNLWTFDNAIWKEMGEALYPETPPNGIYTRPHYKGEAINLLYGDGHAAMARYPLPPETWHFDGR